MIYDSWRILYENPWLVARKREDEDEDEEEQEEEKNEEEEREVKGGVVYILRKGQSSRRSYMR